MKRSKYKKNITAMFIGHVDAGKSTLIGQILVQMKMVSTSVIDSYKKISKDNKKESWYLSYLMDTEDVERERGKTFEMNRISIEVPYKNNETSSNTVAVTGDQDTEGIRGAYLNKETKVFQNKSSYDVPPSDTIANELGEIRTITLLDTPGHTGYITEMLSAAKCADIAILVISCIEKEFEAGLTGTTREHLVLAYNMNIETLVIVLNKIDTCTEAKVDKIEQKIAKLSGFLFKKIKIVRVSAQNNINIALSESCDIVDTTNPGNNISASAYNRGATTDINSNANYQKNIEISNSNISESLSNLTINKKLSLLDILSSIKIPENDYFLASILFSTKHFSEIFINSSSHDVSSKLYSTSDSKPFLLSEVKNDAEEVVQTLECGLFYKVKPFRGMLYNQTLLDSKVDILKGSVLLIEFRLFSKKILVTKGYQCVLHLDSFQTEVIVDKIVKEVCPSKDKLIPSRDIIKKESIVKEELTRKKVILFVKKEDIGVLIRLKCNDEVVSFKGRRCALREAQETVGVGVVRNLK
ncbi:Eukaryotic peptide chain release factor GTP-binding subunit [Cucumispora dikerogammari]|nr:Eukaryotic peptide chain release factor GTP-binding subunit [Cucumispora dikerogammari]